MKHRMSWRLYGVRYQDDENENPGVGGDSEQGDTGFLEALLDSGLAVGTLYPKTIVIHSSQLERQYDMVEYRQQNQPQNHDFQHIRQFQVPLPSPSRTPLRP